MPFPSPRDFYNTGIKPGSFALQANVLPSEPPEKPIGKGKRPKEKKKKRERERETETDKLLLNWLNLFLFSRI